MKIEDITLLKEELKPIFADVANKIGEGTEWGWEIIMKQMYVHAIGYFIAVALSIPLMFVCVWLIRKDLKDWETDGITAGASLGLFGCFIALGVCLFYGVAHIINPEFYALNYLLDLVRPN